LPIEIRGDIAANDVSIDPEFLEKSRGVIELLGQGSVVAIKTSRPSHHVHMGLDSGTSVTMEENSFIADLQVRLKTGSEFSFGVNSYVIGKAGFFCHEAGKIIFGKDCLIGGNLQCLTSDMHGIYEIATKQRINPPGDVIIEDHVWIATDVTILKSTRIGTGCIVGVRSTVAGEFPPNCLILGYPARAIKKGVAWQHGLNPTL